MLLSFRRVFLRQPKTAKELAVEIRDELVRAALITT
jgi:hypothetical protein